MIVLGIVELGRGKDFGRDAAKTSLCQPFWNASREASAADRCASSY